MTSHYVVSGGIAKALSIASLAIVGLGITACGGSSPTGSAEETGETTSGATSERSATTTTVESTTTVSIDLAAPAFPKPADKVENYITEISALSGDTIDPFGPAGDGSVIGATTDKPSVVGYLTDDSGAVVALGVYTPTDGESQVSVPARLLGIVGSSGVVDASDVLGATEAFQLEVLPDLDQLGTRMVFDDNEFFRLTVTSNDGVLWVFEPAGDGPYHGDELRALAELAE